MLDDELLDRLQRGAFDYFVEATNPENGLVADTSREGAPASIAVVGFGLSVWVVAAERGWLTRADAAERVLVTLRFFAGSSQGTDPAATGHRGFYYHFLDRRTGLRMWQCELSPIDTALLFAGVLTAAAYFTAETADERELRAIAQALYARVDWDWARNGKATLAQGWVPESGFYHYGWEGYRGLPPLRARARVAHAPCARDELRRLERDLPVGAHLRLRSALRRSPLRAPVFACVDRLPEDPGRLHAGEAR